MKFKISDMVKYRPISLAPNPLKRLSQSKAFKSAMDCAINCNMEFKKNSRYSLQLHFLHSSEFSLIPWTIFMFPQNPSIGLQNFARSKKVLYLYSIAFQVWNALIGSYATSMTSYLKESHLWKFLFPPEIHSQVSFYCSRRNGGNDSNSRENV